MVGNCTNNPDSQSKIPNRYNVTQDGHTKILVTGATGFIGSTLVKSLSGSNHNLRLLLRESNQHNRIPELQRSEVAIGDLYNLEILKNACAGQQVVVHLAARAHVSSTESIESRRSIVEGTKNLLDAAISQQVQRFVYLSSSLAQAANVGSGDITEYGRLKRAAEELLLDAHQKKLLEVVILRPVNVYGVGMQGNIAGMISRIARNRLPPLPAVNTRISLVSVTDLVQAINLAITAKDAKGRIYTITDGQEYKITDIEKAIYAALGKRIPGWRTPRMILFASALMAGIISQLLRREASIGLRTYRNLTHDNLFDNSAVCDETGFQPSTTFYKELPQIVANISKNL